MAEIRETLRLEVDQALAAVDQVERRLDAATTAEVRVDPSSARVLASALETADRAASNLADQTAATAVAAGRAERSYADLAVSLGVSEAEAARLAGEAREAALSASQIDREARRLATQMGLTQSETRQFVTALRSADRAAEDVADRSDRISRSLGRLRGATVGLVGGFLGLQAVEGLFRAGSTAVTAYADSIEEASKAQVVFGDSFGQINQFVADSATTLRASRTEALQATAAFGAFFTGLGFGAARAAELSTQTTQLAADIGSFNNLDFGEALEKLRSGLAGETEPLRQLGAGFNEAELRARALQLGLGAVNGELTEQEKVIARLSLITSRTASAQGDAARTADDLAGRLRIAQAEIRNLVPALGEALVPAVEAFLDAAPDFLAAATEIAPALAELAVAAGEAAPGIADVAVSLTRFGADTPRIVSGFGSAFAGLFTVFSSNGVDRLREANFQLFALQDAVVTFRGAEDDVTAFANVFADLVDRVGETGAITQERFDQLAQLSGLDPSQLLTATQFLLRQGEAAGFSADQLELLRRNVAALISEVGQPIDAVPLRFTDALASASDVQPLITGLTRLRTEAEAAGATLLEFAVQTADAGGNLLATLVPAEQARVGIELIAEAADQAAGQYGAALDLILTETNKAGEEIPRSAAQIADGFIAEAQRLTDFQAAIATLALSGFDDLAARLQSEGPAALEAGLGFLDDIDAATRAEAALEGQATQITDSLAADLEEAAASGNFDAIGTEIGLSIVAGLTSPAVLAALDGAGRRAASAIQGGVRGDLQMRSPSRVMIDLGILAGESLVTGFARAANRRVPVLQGIQFPAFPSGSGSGSAMTVVNNTVSTSVTLADRDAGFAGAVAAQLAGAVGGQLRGFTGGSVRV